MFTLGQKSEDQGFIHRVMIMATYKEIQSYVKNESGFKPKTCWIAHVKDLCGLSPRIAPNRKDNSVRQLPCPDSKIEAIKMALRYLEMI